MKRPILVFLVLLFVPMLVSGAGSGNVSQNLNLKPQNERIATFGCPAVGRSFPTHMEHIIGGEDTIPYFSVIGLAKSTEETVPYCDWFKEPENKFGIIIYPIGGLDYLYEVPWEKTDIYTREIFQRLKDTGAIVVAFAPFPWFEENSSRLSQEEGVVFAPDVIKDVAGDPYLMADQIHENDEGYGIMAERVAEVLLEAGLVQWAETCENQPQDVPKLFSKAIGLFEEAEEKGIPANCVSKARADYAMAEYLWENRHCCTARWELEEKVIPVLDSLLETMLEHSDEISDMFSRANATITKAKQEGVADRTITIMEGYYANAEGKWKECDLENTEYFLQKVITMSDPTLLSFLSLLGLILLPALLRRRQWF